MPEITQIPNDEFQQTHDSLTPWQKRQWMRAHMPGYVDRDVTKILPYTLMEDLQVKRHNEGMARVAVGKPYHPKDDPDWRSP